MRQVRYAGYKQAIGSNEARLLTGFISGSRMKEGVMHETARR